MKPHKLAQLFPEIPEDEFGQLVADIKRGGLLEPIWTYQGQVLDGWHRYQAAKKAGVAPKTREYRGNDPMGFVVSMNVIRRHLNAGQRAMLLVQAADQAGRLLERGDVESQRSALNADRKTQAELASQIGVGERTVAQAVRVLDKPELARQVIAGELSLEEAERRMHPKPKPSPGANWRQMREVTDILDFLSSWRGELPEMIRAAKAGKLSPEAKRFLAAKLRPMGEMLVSFAEWLER